MMQSGTESKSLQLSAIQKGLYDHLIFLIVSLFCLDLRELLSPLYHCDFPETSSQNLYLKSQLDFFLTCLVSDSAQ